MIFSKGVSSSLGPKFIEREVLVPDGAPIKLLFKKLTATQAESIFSGVSKDNPAKNKGLRDKLIAASVLLPGVDGSDPVHCTVDEAKELPNDFATVLQDIVLEINGLASGEGKKDSEV